MGKRLIVSFLFVLLAATFAISQETYVVDPAHTNVGFSAKHLVISTVSGRFKDFTGTIVFDDKNISNSSVNGTIQSASLDTGNADRDKHLKSADFFDVEKFPEITFKSTKVEKSGDGAKVTGLLTIRGVTKEVSFPATVIGPIKDPWGNMKIGVSAGPLTINRQDYGVSWSKKMDSGGLVVSDEIKIQIDAEAAAKK
ncbi:MAG TPA: YceI family protein [Acidobacteriota bacterium]|nr:YceI family protein [Acidobacteriota bacterium]